MLCLYFGIHTYTSKWELSQRMTAVLFTLPILLTNFWSWRFIKLREGCIVSLLLLLFCFCWILSVCTRLQLFFSLAEDLAFDPTALSTSDTPVLGDVGSGIVRQSFTQQYCSVLFVCCSSFPRQCYTVCALCINSLQRNTGICLFCVEKSVSFKRDWTASPTAHATTVPPVFCSRHWIAIIASTGLHFSSRLHWATVFL